MRRALLLVTAAVTSLTSVAAHAAMSYQYNDGDTGFIVVTSEPGDPDPQGTRGCEYTTTDRPGSSHVQVVVVAHATSDPSAAHGAAVATGVLCRVFNANGGAYVNQALPGTTAAGTATVDVADAPFTICVKSVAIYRDAYVASAQEFCAVPVVAA